MGVNMTKAQQKKINKDFDKAKKLIEKTRLLLHTALSLMNEAENALYSIRTNCTGEVRPEIPKRVIL